MNRNRGFLVRINRRQPLVSAAVVFALFVPAVLAVLAGPSASASSVAPRVLTAPPRVTVGRNAWVAVSVATLWRAPGSPRFVDRPALAYPAGIRAWLSQMTLSDRRGLDGRAD